MRRSLAAAAVLGCTVLAAANAQTVEERVA